jgi:nitrogen fixation NifU-like protein
MDLYAENILDHFKHPRFVGENPTATIIHREDNPSCGDDLTIFLTLEKDRITECVWKGQGCAISQASMSMLSETLLSQTLEEIDQLSPQDILTMLGVPVGPSRMKCAMLSFHTLKNALRKHHGLSLASFAEDMREGN